MAESKITMNPFGIDWSSGTTVSVGVTYNIDKPKVLLGYPNVYAGKDFVFAVNGVTVYQAYSGNPNYATMSQVFIPLKKGDTLRVGGDGQSLGCKLYNVTGA